MTGNVWFVTGSSRGLGRAIVDAALERGDVVVATARDPRALGDLPADRTLALALDVTDEAAAGRAVEAATARFGRIDLVVNNAGYADFGSIEDTPAAQFRAQIETNLMGVVTVTRAAIPVLRRQGHGHFVQISTVGGRIAPGVGLAAYSAAKHGVEGFSGVLANEMKPFGVHVTIVEPGGFRTDWAGSSMGRVEPSAPYAPLIEPMTRHIRGPEVLATGDPAKAGRVIAGLADLAEPPLRLPLGSDAVTLIRGTDEAKIAEIDKWAELSRSTDADDAAPRDFGLLARN